MHARLWVVMLVAVAGACGAGTTAPRPSPAPPSASAPAAPRAPRLSGPADRVLAVTDSSVWKRAARGDVIDRRRLADEAGAIVLLEVVRAGGEPARVALIVLPHAPDAELALEALCAWLARAAPDERPLWLGSVASILRVPPAARERLDVAGLARCDAALAIAEGDVALEPGDRDVAASARQSLREHRSPPAAP